MQDAQQTAGVMVAVETQRQADGMGKELRHHRQTPAVRQPIGIQRDKDTGGNTAKAHRSPQTDVVPSIAVRGIGQCIDSQQQITQRQGDSQPLFSA